MGTPWFATRESVKRALDQAETARANWQIDEALQTATEDVCALLRRIFYPRIVSIKKPWPSIDQRGLEALWLDPSEELVSVTTLTSGGVVIPPTDYYLEPVNQGPPFDQIQINRASNSAFAVSGSGQRSIQIDGIAGYTNVTRPAGQLAEDLDVVETDIDVTDSAAIGVGDLLTIGTEWLIVTDRKMLTTGQSLQAPVGANSNETALAVTNGTAYRIGEILLLDTERMQIEDITGNTLVVKRAVGGSVLAAHAAPVIFAGRTLVVERAALGSTVATHPNNDPIRRQDWPALVRQLCRAEAINNLLQDRSGYARTVGSGENERESSGRGLADLRKRALRAHGILTRGATV